MNEPMQAPDESELLRLGLEPQSPDVDEPWVQRVRTLAEDGDALEVTWDTVAGSIVARCTDGQGDRWQLNRELVSRRAVESDGPLLRFTVVMTAAELVGTLTIEVGPHVELRDSILNS